MIPSLPWASGAPVSTRSASLRVDQTTRRHGRCRPIETSEQPQLDVGFVQ